MENKSSHDTPRINVNIKDAKEMNVIIGDAVELQFHIYDDLVKDDNINLHWQQKLNLPQTSDFVVCDIYKQCECKNFRSLNCKSNFCKFNSFKKNLLNNSKLNDGLDFMNILSDDLKF